VDVDIRHTYIGDLRVDLVAPDGSVYLLQNRSGGSADNIVRSYTLDLSAEALDGTWRLRVGDRGRGDTGKIDSWSIMF
jgi:subtilisin-like proprotein convertase family protein